MVAFDAGKRLGPYEIRSLIGSGDMGEVYKALDTRLNRTVAIDGRWLAYESNETGRWEVYVTTFPPSGTKLSVTTERGVDSLWSNDGEKIFYANPVTGDLWSVDVKPGNPPEFRARRRIYAGSLDYSSAHSFSIDTNLQRVLIQIPTAPKVDIRILLNWQSSIKN